MPKVENAAVDRRQFLHTAVAGAVAGIATRSGFWPGFERTLAPRVTPTAGTALQELLAGNQRFAANHLTSTRRDLPALRERTVDKQEPFAAVLACADSRVPVELVFDQSAGDVEKAVEINARMQAGLLRGSSTVIREATTAGKLEVAAGVYDLATGRVTMC